MTDFFNVQIGFQTDDVFVQPGLNVTSSATHLEGFGMVGIIMPPTLTSTSMAFTGSQDNKNFYDLYNTAGELLVISIAPNRIVLFSPGDFVGINFIKLILNNNEAAIRSFKVISRSFQ